MKDSVLIRRRFPMRGCIGSGKRMTDGLSMVRAGPRYAALFIFGVLMLRIFTMNVSASMPPGIYMRLPPVGIEKGDLIEFDNPMNSDMWGVGVRHGLLKRVTDISEDGMYYVLGEHPLSYDSRYYGWIGKEYVKHKIWQIWVPENIPLMPKEYLYDRTG